MLIVFAGIGQEAGILIQTYTDMDTQPTTLLRCSKHLFYRYLEKDLDVSLLIPATWQSELFFVLHCRYINYPSTTFVFKTSINNNMFER